MTLLVRLLLLLLLLLARTVLLLVGWLSATRLGRRTRALELLKRGLSLLLTLKPIAVVVGMSTRRLRRRTSMAARREGMREHAHATTATEWAVVVVIRVKVVVVEAAAAVEQ